MDSVPLFLMGQEHFELIHPTSADLRRMAELVNTYHDLPLGPVDASVLALAERPGDYDIATLDRRHFTVVRPAGNRVLNLYP